MAGKAHVDDGYSFASGARALRRRQAWYRNDDPVALPRTSIWSAGGGAIATALATAALLIGSAYTAYRGAPPSMTETPASPLADNWQPDSHAGEARVVNLLYGPALSVPTKPASPGEISSETDAPSIASAREVALDDSTTYLPQLESAAPRLESVDPGEPGIAPPAPYPNPTTTPPDAIAPPDFDRDRRTPILDAENPNRDGL